MQLPHFFLNGTGSEASRFRANSQNIPVARQVGGDRPADDRPADDRPEMQARNADMGSRRGGAGLHGHRHNRSTRLAYGLSQRRGLRGAAGATRTRSGPGRECFRIRANVTKSDRGLQLAAQLLIPGLVAYQYRTAQPPCGPFAMQKRKYLEGRNSGPGVNTFGIRRSLALNWFMKYGPEEVRSFFDYTGNGT
jgi:hypothetical protein